MVKITAKCYDLNFEDFTSKNNSYLIKLTTNRQVTDGMLLTRDEIIDKNSSKHAQKISPERIKLKKKKVADSNQKVTDGSPYRIQKKEKYSESGSSVKASKNPLQPTKQ